MNDDLDEKQWRFASNVLERKWEAVVDFCDQYPRQCGQRITRLRETALHLAVTGCEEDVVRKLVQILESKLTADDAVDVLKTRNIEGNTPLHLAVLVGKVEMCRCIYDGRPQLLGVRNEQGETPLFLAARVGEMDAFTCLLREMDTQLQYVRIRNYKADTILHCAIDGEHWNLASLIIEQFPDLHFSRNEEGVTPLHVLANKPGVFKSGTYLSPFGKLIYHLLIPPPAGYDEGKTSLGTTCGCEGNVLPSCAPHRFPQSTIDIPEGGGSHKNQAGSSTVPTTYDTCMTFINLLNVTVRHLMDTFVLSWLEKLKYIQKIKKKKETNVLSQKILDRLLRKYRCYATSHLRGSFIPSSPGYEGARSDLDDQERGKSIPGFDGTRGDLDDQERKKSIRGGKRAVLVSLQGKDGLRGDPIIVADGTGCVANPITVAADRSADPIIVGGPTGKRLFNELCTKYIMNASGSTEEEVRVVETPPTFLKNKGDIFQEIKQKLLHVYPISTYDPDMAEKNHIIVAGSAAEHLFHSAHSDAISRSMTPFLLAAQNGIEEMVDKILKVDPRSIHDLNLEYKNALLLAAENRQPQVYQLLERYGKGSNRLFRAVDTDGCTALHLAARLSPDRPCFILGLPMQQEARWYEYVRASVPRDFLCRRNNMNETANEIFMKDHKELMEKDKQWVKETATACSVVGTFIAGLAFTASTTGPGGIKNGSEKPLDAQHQAASDMFSVSSYIALYFSISSVVLFLATFISRNNVRDFGRDLPVKFLPGLTCLFASMWSMLVTSLADLFFLPKYVIRIPGLVMFAVTSLLATYVAATQLPFYVELIWATFSSMPQRRVEEARC